MKTKKEFDNTILFDVEDIETQLKRIQNIVNSFNGKEITIKDVPLFKEPLMALREMLSKTEIYKNFHGPQMKEFKEKFLSKYEKYERKQIGFLFLIKIFDNMFTPLNKNESAIQRSMALTSALCQFVPCVLYSIGGNEYFPEGEYNYKGKIKTFKTIKGNT